MSKQQWEGIAFRYIMDKYKIPREQLTSSAPSTGVRGRVLPLTNVVLFEWTVTQPTGNVEIWIVGIDQNGRAYEPDGITVLEQAERVASLAKYGKLEPPLFDLLQTKSPEDKVLVNVMVSGGRSMSEVWAVVVARYPEAHLNPSTPGIPSRDTPADFYSKVVEPEFWREYETSNRAASRPLADYLVAKGYFVTQLRSGPGVSGSLPKKIVLELAQRADVAYIAGVGEARPGMLNAEAWPVIARNPDKSG